MNVLPARIYEAEKQKQREEQEARHDKKEIGFGSQIRSYVLHPYKMVKDLRSGYETGNTQGVLNGRLDPFIEAYLRSIVGETVEPGR